MPGPGGERICGCPMSGSHFGDFASLSYEVCTSKAKEGCHGGPVRFYGVPTGGRGGSASGRHVAPDVRSGSAARNGGNAGGVCAASVRWSLCGVAGIVYPVDRIGVLLRRTCVRSAGCRKIVFSPETSSAAATSCRPGRGNGERSAGILSGRGTNDRRPERTQGCMLRRAQPCDTVRTGRYGGNQNSSSPRSTSATIRSICCQIASGNVVPVTSITLPAAMAPIVPHCFIDSPLQRPERNPAA